MRRLNWDRRVKRSSSRCRFRASAYWSRSRRSANRFSRPSSYSLCPGTHSSVSSSTLLSQQQHSPHSATALSSVSNSTLLSQQQHSPQSATALSSVSNSTIYSPQQRSPQSATTLLGQQQHSSVSHSILSQQQHTALSSVSNSTLLSQQ